jgi:hypothetical protein
LQEGWLIHGKILLGFAKESVEPNKEKAGGIWQLCLYVQNHASGLPDSTVGELRPRKFHVIRKNRAACEMQTKSVSSL